MICINGARRCTVQLFAAVGTHQLPVNFVGQKRSCSDGPDPFSHTPQPVVADAQRFQVFDRTEIKAPCHEVCRDWPLGPANDRDVRMRAIIPFGGRRGVLADRNKYIARWLRLICLANRLASPMQSAPHRRPFACWRPRFCQTALPIVARVRNGPSLNPLLPGFERCAVKLLGASFR